MPKDNYREKLIRQTKKGGFTLILGAGVSRSYGLPTWEELAKRVWNKTFSRKKSPWEIMGSHSPKYLPQFLPMVFEQVYHKLGPTEFLTQLKASLYEGAEEPDEDSISNASSTLAVIARLLLREYRAREKCRINRIITLNADDYLEEAVRSLARDNENPVQIIATPVGHPKEGGARRPIPFYHIHGYVPSSIPFGSLIKEEQKIRHISLYQNSLIFTDSQYWQSASTILSYANRTVGAALHDSHCLFIGLSMTDINILRWLALRHEEIEQVEDYQCQVIMKNWTPKRKDSPLLNLAKKGVAWLSTNQIRKKLRRHYWIRPNKDDPTDFLSEFLELRGVQSVAIRSWKGKYFEKLIERCFPQYGNP